VTICVKQGVPNILEQIGPPMVDVLKERADRSGVRLHGYCVMPDHVHIVCSIESEKSDFQAFVRTFKRETSRRAHRLGCASFAWQRDYWDRFIRVEEDVVEIIKYVLANPVRKGLCERPEDWPWSEFIGWS